MQGITVLGSTGSIGTNALAVIARHPRRYRVVALSAYTRADALLQQCLTFAPEYAVLSDPDEAERMEQQLRAQGSACQVLCGREGLVRIAALQQAAVVIAGIVGAAGLEPTLAAVTAGKRVLLANKEALVMAGEIFMAAVRSHSATLLPLDSEHSAIHQALPRGFNGNLHAAGVRRIVLTASGGPFRLLDSKDLESVTIEQACAHPNWVMGPKISVDSATMMNKGLEVIEAHWLFGADADRIGVVVHPQSIVHSMVEYRDGSTLAQLGQPDMCTPIAYALAYPERIDAGVEAVDLTRVGRLDFHAPDPERFPCLRLAAAALHAGGITPAVLNAANEVAVERFLAGDIRFPSIARLTEDVLGRIANQPARTLDAVLAADANARECARTWMPSANSRTPRVSAFSTTSAG